MTDVFISYASSDRERARTLASALAARGWSVWWDRKIKAGQIFDEVIERELETAKNIVVLWSNDSISSEWVKNEAAVAAQRGVLVPVLIDSVKVSLEFRRKQTADLIGWDGSSSHPGFQALCEALEGTTMSDPATPHGSPIRLDRRIRGAVHGCWLLLQGLSLYLWALILFCVIHKTSSRLVKMEVAPLQFRRVFRQCQDRVIRI